MRITPESPEHLAAELAECGERGQAVVLAGRNTKDTMGGPIEEHAVTVSTANMNRVLQYEPRDLTISVEAGITYCELNQLLAKNRQMIPLDPAFSDQATVGGIIAANNSGPRRRLYGTARDLVIGMKFATLEGKLIQSGGMVVKNVAGLDMAKLMIGSFGTLAAVAVVNFKILPIPEVSRTFLLSFATLDAAMAARDAILQSTLQPAALDLLNPEAARGIGIRQWVLAMEAVGNGIAIDRTERELAALGEGRALEGAGASSFWRYIQNFTSNFMAVHQDGAVVRISCTLKELGAVLEAAPGAALARAGSGVCYLYFDEAQRGVEWARCSSWSAVVECAPPAVKQGAELWPSPGDDFPIMQRVKNMFDPRNLLNRGRLFGRI